MIFFFFLDEMKFKSKKNYIWTNIFRENFKNFKNKNNVDQNVQNF